MHRFALPLLTTFVFFVSPLVSRADFVPWSYNFTPSALVIPADIPGTGGLDMTNEPTKHADGTSDVVVTNIRSFSSAPRNHADHFTHATYSFTLLLTDLLSGQVATLHFGGFFTGSVSVTSANVANHFSPPLAQTVVLGGHTYTINLGFYSPPGPPDASNAGSISAHIGVDEIPNPGGDPGPGSHHAPEPSTLVLSGLGLTGLGMAAWRRWRRNRTSPLAVA